MQESAAGIVEIHANDAVKLQLTDFANLLGPDLRHPVRDLPAQSSLSNFSTTFIAQLTPFFFYSIGGYLVIRGSLSFGALVAVLAAYKDMASPWKELLDFYQHKEDSRIKYEQIVEQFQPAGMIDARLLLDEPETIPPLTGELLGRQSVAGRGRPQPRPRRRQLHGAARRARRGHRPERQRQERARDCCWRGWCSRPAGRITIGGVDIADTAGSR